MATIKYIHLNNKSYPDVMSVVCELASLLERKPHDIARRLILKAGLQELEQLKSSIDSVSPSVVDKECSGAAGECQGKSEGVGK